MTKKYVIATEVNLDTMYLFWQPSDWDGWTWGYLDVFEEVLSEHPKWNQHPHSFVFNDKDSAMDTAKKMEIPYFWFIKEYQVKDVV